MKTRTTTAVAAWFAAGLLALSLVAPALGQDSPKVRELLEALASDSVFEREEAEQALLAIGPAILPLLEKQTRAMCDPEVASRVSRIQSRLQAQTEALVLAKIVSKDLGKEGEFLSQISSKDPEFVLAALGQMSGYTAILRNGAISFVSAPQRYSVSRSDINVLLREVFRKDSGRDPRWIPALATALRMAQDHRVGEALGSIEVLLRSPHAPLRELASQAAAANAGSLEKEEKEAWLRRFGGLLHDPSAEVRASAAAAILSLGTKDQLPVLLRHRKDPSEDVRLRLVDAIVGWEATDRAPLLAEMTRDDSPRVRRHALAALGALKAQEHVPKLTYLLQDPDEYVRLEYMNVIRHLEHRGCLDIAARALRDGCTYVRARALELLDLLDGARHAAAVGALLDDHEFESIRIHAIKLLGRWKATDHTPSLVRLLRDPKPSIRSAALESLRVMAARETAPQIATLIEDPSPAVRIGAARALVEWDEQREAIERLLASSDESVSLAVATLLAEAGRREGARRLLRAAAGSNAQQRAEALYALNALEAPALYSRLASLRLEDRRFDSSSLREILSFVAQEASLQVAFETLANRKCEARSVGLPGHAGALLVRLMREGDGEFALVLDEAGGRLRAVTLAAALEHWQKVFEPR